MDQDLKQAFAWMDDIFQELRLPGVSKGTFMNHPSLQHRRKSIIGSKDGKALVVHCPLDIKEVLIEAEPEVYYQTDHYMGYPALLMRPENVNKEMMRQRIEAAWRMNATKAQIAAFEESDSSDG